MKNDIAIMIMIMLTALLAAGLAAQEVTAPVAARSATFQGLGDLSGGNFESLGLRISADGSVVVGNSMTASGKQAFRWTQREGMVCLDVLQVITKHPETFVCDYLNETPPNNEPVVFGRGVVSVDGKNTHALQFSPDGHTLIFSRYPDKTSFRMMHGKGGWSKPEQTSFTGKEVTFDAARKRLFYYDGGDLFYVKYDNDGYSKPTPLNVSINTQEAEYYPCVTARGNLFFSRNSKWDQGRIMMSKPLGENFDAPVDLGNVVNLGGASHGFVAPDESYLLFNSPRAGSYTKNDIWISIRRPDGAWSAPINLGPRVNRDAMAVLCPTVSPDGKYLFFTKLNSTTNTGFIYWVSTKVIDDIKKEVFNHKK